MEAMGTLAWAERTGGTIDGRTALKALLQALDLQDAEVIAPSYTCVVVQHATLLSGNVPVFVDNTMTDYNMDLDLLAAAITPRTGAILAGLAVA